MPRDVIEKYQVAGVDERERGFSRPVDLQSEDNRYRATLHYETSLLAGERADTKEAALSDLIRTLHAHGYTQLKSQLSFRGPQYLGSQEPWIEYPDPERPSEQPSGLGGLFRQVARLFQR
jgi:hypothetical protein